MGGLSRHRAKKVLEKFPALKVGVMGDFNLDAYWYADMTQAQLSRETPLFPRPVIRETYNPGGAANVAWNLAALGVGHVTAFSVFGTDWRGVLLRATLEAAGVDLSFCVTAHDRITPMFGKIILTAYETQQEDARLDFVNEVSANPHQQNELMDKLYQALFGLDALVIADYFPEGVFNSQIRERIDEVVHHTDRLVCVADSREHIGDFPHLIIKPNRMEASRLFFPSKPAEAVTLEMLSQASLELSVNNGKPSYVTLGAEGCLVAYQGQCTHLHPARLPFPIDPVGAGDSFLACLAASLAAGASPQEAGILANLAAAVTICKTRVTGTASPQEILDWWNIQECSV